MAMKFALLIYKLYPIAFFTIFIFSLEVSFANNVKATSGAVCGQYDVITLSSITIG